MTQADYMRQADAAQMWPIIKAWAEGEELQYADTGGNWIDYAEKGSAHFYNSGAGYRIKPKPVMIRVTYNEHFISISKPDDMSVCVDCPLSNAKTIEVELPQ